jgi:malate synthase
MTQQAPGSADGVTVDGPPQDRYGEVLTDRALALIALLHRRFDGRRRQLLDARQERYAQLAAGATLGFLPETEEIRQDPSWQVAPPAPGLVDRRVEITGPTDRKMTINALNSGAKVWLADQEDANTPHWGNVISGPLNLGDALARTIDFETNGKQYTLGTETATIVVRPRGWHLPEKHLRVDGEPVSGSLVDFALHLEHNGQALLDAGRGPYFYLPKMEGHLEARLWNDVFGAAQEFLGMPRGTIRATCLIETYPAAFEMEEILYELREHSSGLNAGRWDYLFSVIKKFRTRGTEFLLPDRNSVTMTAPFMRNRRDAEVTEVAMRKVREDKTREANDGFDGSWVAHPDMVELCREVFDSVLGDKPNQLDRRREDVHVTAEQLLDVAATPGEVTEAGLRNDVSVGIQYLESWLRGGGAVAIFNLMEDAATAEIARSQVWQWLHNSVRLADGQTVTRELVEQVIAEELAKVRTDDEGRRWDSARDLFAEMALSDDFSEFLTLPAYERMP